MPTKKTPATMKSGRKPVALSLSTSLLSNGTVWGLLCHLSTQELAGHLRARGIGIPKRKDAMPDRLTEHLQRDGATVSLSFT